MKKFDNYKMGLEKNIFDAVWQYVIDHAEVDRNGTYFVKFHTDGKEEFAKRIRRRMKGLYRQSITDAGELLDYKKLQEKKRIDENTLHQKQLANLKEKELKKSNVAKNLMELQRNHKTTIKRQNWFMRLFN